MNAFEAAGRIGSCFDEDAIEYAIGGALALTAWALPRDTKDVDISVYCAADELPRVLESLERAGVMVDRAAAVRDHARMGLFYGLLGHTRVDVFISEHPQFLESRRRRKQVILPDGTALWFVSAEDLVVNKLFFGRAKDVPDLERLFAAVDLDLDYVQHWLEQMVPAGDRRRALLQDLRSRFAR